jgi:AsmA protein
LAALDVLLPDTFLKPAGTPMGLSVDGDFTASDASLRGLSLRLDELDVRLSGTVKDFSAPALDLKLEARPFSFDRLARLLPAANKALAASGAKASGDGKLSGHVKGTLTDLDAGLELGLLGVKLDVPGTRLDGDLTVAVGARGNPEKSLSATLRLDADKAVIVVDGMVDKSSSTPALLDAAIRRDGDRVDVQKLALRFAELQLSASGNLDLAAGATNLKVELARLDLEKFARTVTAIPAAQAKKGFVDAKVAVQGDPNRLETMEVRIDPLNALFGGSDLRGSMRVVDLLAPKVELRISSNNLDVDELMGEAAEEPAATEPQADAAAAQDDPSLKSYGFRGSFDLKRVVVSKTELRDFRGEVSLAEGKLRLEDATFGVFGGTVSAKGTEAEIWKAKMPFRANLAVKGIEINDALTAKTRYANTLFGKTDLGVELAGEGFETADLEKALNGKLAVALTQGRLARASLTQAVVGDLSALEKVPGVKLTPLTAQNVIKDLAADFEVRNGRLELKKPMTLDLDGSRVSLTGAIGIAGGLFFEGSYFLAPAVVDRLTAGRCKSPEELQIPVAIRGTVDAPEFKPEATRIVTALAERCLKGAVADKAGQLLGDKARQVIGVSS